MEKPALALLVGHALKQKGMVKDAPSDDSHESDGDMEMCKEHLLQVADDFLKAVEDKDASALAELLQEAFECLEAMPHAEGAHEAS